MIKAKHFIVAALVLLSLSGCGGPKTTRTDEPVGLVTDQVKTWETYTNNEFGFSINYSDRDYFEFSGDNPRYIRFQNYQSQEGYVLNAGDYYTEIMFFDKSVGSMQGSCDGSVAGSKEVNIAGYTAYRYSGSDLPETGGNRFEICATGEKYDFVFASTENPANGEFANAILDSVKIFPADTTMTLPKAAERITWNQWSTDGQYCRDYPENYDYLYMPFSSKDFGMNYAEGYGYADLSGTVSAKDALYYYDKVTAVNFAIDEPAYDGKGANFYKYFGTPDGNSFKSVTAFSLGILENGKLSSTAYYTPETETKILNAIRTGEKIVLTLRVPRYLGRGAPSNFTPACVIE